MGAFSRSKGAQGERELANELTAELGVKVARNLLQVREGGYDLKGLPIALEVKRQESLNLKAWWGQTIDQAGELLPVLAYRQNRKPWKFILPAYGINDAFGSPIQQPLAWMHDFEHTVEIRMPLFVAMVREML